MSLLSLPLELRQHIAGGLEPSALRSFSLTSVACHEASLFAVFERICLTVYEPEDLRRDVIALREALSYTSSFSCVRHITIKGALRGKELEHSSERWPNGSIWTDSLDMVSPLLDEDKIYYRGMYVVPDREVIEPSSDEDIAWAPLVNLLDKAEISLGDLVFDCRSQFPPTLLRLLHKRHPRCRLHHLTFNLRSLLCATPHAYEIELATSPCLSTVKAICTRRDSNGTDDFNQEALMELVAGLAPNLSEVIILNLCPGGSRRSGRPRKLWQSLPGFVPRKKGLLKSLSFRGITRLIDPQVLQDWARHIDFTSLQHLALGGYLNIHRGGLTGETMEWMQTQSFPRLQTLSVYLSRNDLWVERPHFSHQAILFFRSFEPLKQLSIVGPMDYQIVDAVLAHYGQSLRKLSLHPLEAIPFQPNGRDPQDLPFHFTKDCVLQLRDQCPNLEELTILVKRNMSRASEAELYKCFGEMKALRALSLILDCSNWRVTRDPTHEPDFDEQDREPVDAERQWLKIGDVKETLINCAIDEALAWSIWKTISQIKTGRPLERLKLWPTEAGEYGTESRMSFKFKGVVYELARSWSIERDPRGDTEGFTVKELQLERRLMLRERFASFMSSHRQDPWLWDICRSIWPSRDGTDDSREDWSKFRDDWSSFPLEELPRGS